MSNYLKTSRSCSSSLTQLTAGSAAAAPQAGTSNVPVTTIVTVLGPNYSAPPALGKSDVVVRTGNRREDVVAWDSAQGDKSTLQLAIVIDDLADIGSQIEDLRKFIQSQPKSTSVGLFYAQNGITQAVAPFSADHGDVAKKARHHHRSPRRVDQHLSFADGRDEEVSRHRLAPRNPGHRRRHRPFSGRSQ